MKELLLKLKDGSYSYTNSDMDSVPAYTEVIEIPKGAIKLTTDDSYKLVCGVGVND